MFQVNVHVHNSYSNCETCGYNGSTVVTISGDLGEAEFGEGATCFSGEDADWRGIALWLCGRLNANCKDFPELLTRNLVDNLEQAYNTYPASVYVDQKWVEE